MLSMWPVWRYHSGLTPKENLLLSLAHFDHLSLNDFYFYYIFFMIQYKKVGTTTEMQHWFICSNENDPKYSLHLYHQTVPSCCHCTGPTFSSSAMQSPSATFIVMQCRCPPSSGYFYLLPKALWNDINLARPVKSLPAVFRSHYCS